jgi:hypothetical protein
MPRDEVETGLRQAIARSSQLRPSNLATGADRASFLAAFRTWDEFNRRLLERGFTPVSWHESSPKTDYGTLRDLEFVAVDELPEEKVDTLDRLIAEKVRRLGSLLDSLQLYQSTEDPGSGPVPAVGTEPKDAPQTMFVVHGRDKAALLAVQQFLERVTGLRPVVLSEQPNQGQTIIEKLGTHLAHDAFAVILMTADDEGRLRDEGNELALRARQNVVFELGYSVARLGRDHVAVLHEDGVELPSDYYGVVYIPFDAGGGWRLALIGELRAVGIEADANKAV